MKVLGQRTTQKARGTARRILEHARQAFNERGVSAVGVRDIARELDLSPGNVTYHFPTKEALIAALVEEVHAANNSSVAMPGPMDFVQVDRVIRAIMLRDAEHQWFHRDAAGLLLSLPTLRDRHDLMQRAREARVQSIIDRLIEAGLLDGARTDRELLQVQLLTLVFFWVAAALLAAPHRDPAERLDLHARAALGTFAAYASPAGSRQLATLLAPHPSPPG